MAQKVGEFQIKMMYRNELAACYGVGERVFKRMVKTTTERLKEKGVEFDFPKGRTLLSINTVKLFVEHNGEP